MSLRPTVAGKRFHLKPRLRTTSLLRTASIFLVFTASFFVFFNFKVTARPAQPLIPIDDSHTAIDSEFADLSAVNTPPKPLHHDHYVPNEISFANGLEHGSSAADWGRDDGPRPIPLPPHDAPVNFPEPVIPPLLRSSSWHDPIQPILDPTRFITTDDLRTSFGVLPTNRTLVDKRLAIRLENYDIREDDQFRQLAIHANLTSIFLRYNYIARRGWGSLFPSDPSDQPRDNLYHIRHSGIPQKGYAVYASVDIPADSILGVYGGELMDASDAPDGQYSWEAPTMTLIDPITHIKKKHVMVIDSSRVGNLLRFVNDLGKENDNVDAAWAPIDNRWNLFYFTTKNISEGDELSISYGDSYWSHNSDSNRSNDRSDHGEGSEGAPIEQNLIDETISQSAVLMDHESIGTGVFEHSDTHAAPEVLHHAPDSVHEATLSSSIDRESEMLTDHHLSPAQPHPPAFRKVALRKQYLERVPPLSPDFIKAPADTHAQGTRYR